MKNPLHKKPDAFEEHLQPNCRPGVFSKEAFQYLIQRERARADRENSHFSLAVFQLRDKRGKHSSEQVIRLLENRIRMTDAIGWTGPATLGVLLPATLTEGANIFARDVVQALKKSILPPEYKVYTYPAEKEDTAPAESENFFSEMLAVEPSAVRIITERTAAGIALALLSPLMLLITVSIKISSPGPVFFFQPRVGYKGRNFLCCKFRTMHLNSDTEVHANYLAYLMESDTPMNKLDAAGDPRIFPIGRLLRASSMDELPQLINIFKGQMSLVGPRPCTLYEYEQYRPWQRHRIDTLPGLTGLWQVSGKNRTTFTEMMRLDMRYVTRQSLRMNLAIVFRTFPVLIRLYLDDHRHRSKQEEHDNVPLL